MHTALTRIATGLAVSAAALVSSAAPPGPAELEDRLWRLEVELNRHAAAGAWDEAVAVIREMAALDPDHPKPYIEAVQIMNRRGTLEDAGALMDGLGPPDGPGRSLGQGMLLAFTGRAEEAASRISRALEAYRSRGHLAGQAAAHNALGILARGGGRLEEAAERFAAALSFLEQIPERRNRLAILANLAEVEAARGRPEAALERQRSLLSLREEIGDRPGQARTWNDIATTLVRMRDERGALEAFDRALRIRREIADLPGQISTLEMMAGACADFDHWDASADRFESALELAATSPEPAARASVLRNMGNTFLAHGRNREATEPLETAAGLYRDLGKPREQARTLALLGTALNELGRFPRAREVLTTSVNLARGLGDGAVEAAALMNLGNVSLAAGDFADALIHQQRALMLHRQAGNRVAERWSLNNLAAVYFSLGKYDRARGYIEDTLRLAEAQSDAEAVALAWHNLGAILAEEGRLDEALEWIRRSIEARRGLGDRRGAALGHANAAETLLSLGRPDEASAELIEALAAFREAEDLGGESLALNLRGELHLAVGKPEAAVADHRSALGLAERAGLGEQQGRAHAGLSAALAAEGRGQAALAEVLLAIEQVEHVRARLETDEFKMRFLARKIDLYERALSILLGPAGREPSRQAVAQAFELAERARARSLLDLLAESRSPLRTRMTPELQRREAEVLDRVSAAAAGLSRAPDGESREAARRELTEAETRLESLEIEIRRAAPRYGEIVYPRAASLEDVRTRVLRAGEVLLEYFVGQHHAWVWIVERDGVRLHRLASPEVIAASVRSFLEESTAPGADLGGHRRDVEAAKRLAAVVLPDSIPRDARVLVAPDGALHHVPFEALRVGNRFLVERHEIVLVPSATALRVMREQPTRVAPDGFLGVGDPVLGPGDADLPALPFSGAEVEGIARLFPDASRRVLTGAEATETEIHALDLDRFRFVHFATHGLLEAREPGRGGLVLSHRGGDGSDGLLSLEEIFALRLASEVVVISACRSGLGELLRGEGLVSLTRAFLYAGSRTVLVSLWDVGDRSTADFMREVYRGLLDGATAPAAVRRAKLGFLGSDRASRRRILRWAPFVLVGDPGEPSNVLNHGAAAPTLD